MNIAQSVILPSYYANFLFYFACCSGGNSEEKSVWEHLNVPLPDLEYNMEKIRSQQKSTTTFVSHSITPATVKKWDTFKEEVLNFGRECNDTVSSEPVTAILQRVKSTAFVKVGCEEDVTQNTVRLLNNTITPFAGCYADASHQVFYLNYLSICFRIMVKLGNKGYT
eukprot:m.295000 g.295000  ORF g.295000 m.295000 type:complete len:167 (+) comp16392_c0_seq10:682-1182(+)